MNLREPVCKFIQQPLNDFFPCQVKSNMASVVCLQLMEFAISSGYITLESPISHLVSHQLSQNFSPNCPKLDSRNIPTTDLFDVRKSSVRRPKAIFFSFLHLVDNYLPTKLSISLSLSDCIVIFLVVKEVVAHGGTMCLVLSPGFIVWTVLFTLHLNSRANI